MDHMKLEILTPDELTQEETDLLWTQGLNMDDWDYMVIGPVEALDSQMPPDDPEDGPSAQWYVQDYTLERLLTGCSDNRWYKGTFRGAECAIGIAYHA